MHYFFIILIFKIDHVVHPVRLFPEKSVNRKEPIRTFVCTTKLHQNSCIIMVFISLYQNKSKNLPDKHSVKRLRPRSISLTVRKAKHSPKSDIFSDLGLCFIKNTLMNIQW